MTRPFVRTLCAAASLFAFGYALSRWLTKDSDENRCCGGSCQSKTPTKKSEGGRTNSPNMIPGQAKVYLHTYGCAHNSSDAEYMLGLLSQFGYQIVDTWEEADAVILNSCTVKNPSQEAAMTLVQRAKSAGKAIIVGGCVPQADRNVKGWHDVSMIGVTQIDRIVEVVGESLKGNVVKMLEKSELPSLDLPKIRRNDLVEIIPLSTGCLGRCTYCKTVQARGKLGSYVLEAILSRVRQAVNENVQQIWLTSEDTGAYGIDLGLNVIDLLTAIRDEVMSNPLARQNNVMVRVGMTNPPYILEHLEDMANILKSECFFEFLHIPVQSGSNAVLSSMMRDYTVEEFCQVCDYLREHVPHIYLGTDVICGFPTEKDDDHKFTLDLLDHYKFEMINISQFYPRPGTPAAKLQQLNTKTKKSRSREVTALTKAIPSKHAHLVGKTVDVWFSEPSDRSDHTVGHTKQYVKVLVPTDTGLIGTKRSVHIDSFSKWHITGHVTECS
ncbi:MAG: hypothetical protein KVP17_000715 [Porospora cf. gigantea B]|uniref:uncharacterized protein n=2 Tax=Porospora cf. gigantea B TaxID=2853592 RepID=UPI003571865D|nr:MAG: hypothetical protein KVP17_000715 [Porospora cf. gigantea B]